MAQTINPVKLKAAAEHLEWVLQQYPESEEVQSLHCALATLIEDAKAKRLSDPIASNHIPGAYNFGEGVYAPYQNPSVDDAYTKFRIEMRGGLNEQEKRIIARMAASASDAKP